MFTLFLFPHQFPVVALLSIIVFAETLVEFASNSTVISSKRFLTLSSSSPLVVILTMTAILFSFQVTISIFPYLFDTFKVASLLTLNSLEIVLFLMYFPFFSVAKMANGINKKRKKSL